MDLFIDYKKQPEKLAKVVDYWQDIQTTIGLNYRYCKTFLNEVEAIGYTFEYGLDSEPYNLRKIK